MAVVCKRQNSDIQETWDETTNTCSSAEITFFLLGVTSPSEAISAVRTASDGNYNGLPRSSISISSYNADGTVTVRVRYAPQTKYTESETQTSPVLSITCSNGVKHMSEALSQTRLYGNTDAGKLINWNGKTGSESEISGVDVPFPSLQMTYTKVVSKSSVTAQNMRNWASLIGCVNNASFKGWNAGEVVFNGYSLSYDEKNATTVEIRYDFDIHMNENVTITGGSTFTKLGWQYMWTLNKESVADGNKKSDVDSIYLADVVKSADFSLLGLDGSTSSN